MSRVGDLSLMVYLTVINSKKLEDIMVKWSGCDKEVYTENVLVDIYQSALSDITNAYHIPSMFYHYFDGKKTQKILETFGKYKYSEIEALRTPFFWIPVKTWDKEDHERLVKLKKEYIGDEIE